MKEYLVIYTYKGHTNRRIIEADEFSILDEMTRCKIKGVIDEIHEEWYYDPETLVPTPGELP